MADVRIVGELGAGRPFLLLYENNSYKKMAEALGGELAKKTRVIVAESTSVDKYNWGRLSGELLGHIRDKKIRQLSLVSFGEASSLVQNIALLEPRLARTIVLVDASTRPHPNYFSRTIDWLERILPLGLPLRTRTVAFDAKPFLQRIRCPVLVVCMGGATPFIRGEASILAAHLPTSWQIALPGSGVVGDGVVGDGEVGSGGVEALTSLVLDFEEVPAKCPQKNVAQASV